MKPATRLVRGGSLAADPYRATAPPLYQTATFEQADPERPPEFDYTRSGNPTRRQLEERVAELEGGRFGFAFASGMAALAASARLARPGESVLAGSDLYGGSYRLLERCLAPYGVEVRYADVRDLDGLDAALDATTRLALFESPTNPLMHTADLAAVAERCRRHGTLLAVDNTLLSPLRQTPLAAGADLVIHSATKHLGGHGDATAGVVVTRDEAVAEHLGFLQNAEGSGLAPLEAWLILRGLKTLGVRLDRAEATARDLARRLGDHPAVGRVRYPGQGSVLSLELEDAARADALARSLELFTLSVSFGSVTSQVCLPARMSHASIPAAVRAARNMPPGLVRLSVGLEDAGDLWEDLARALDRVGSPCSLQG